MIRFNCPGCGYQYACTDQHAGRRAKCTQCAAPIVVPDRTPIEELPAPVERESSTSVATLAAKQERAKAIVAALSPQRVEIQKTLEDATSSDRHDPGLAGVLGGLSIALALIALGLIFFFPITVFPVAAVGMMLAAVGIVVARRHGGGGRSIAIAGGVACWALPIAYGLLTTLMASIENQDSVLRAEVAKAIAPTPAPQSMTDEPPPATAKKPSPLAVLEALQRTATFAEPKQLGDAAVSIISAHIDVGPTKTIAEMRADKSDTFGYSLKRLQAEQEFLVLRIRVKNVNPSQELQYTSWGGDRAAVFDATATLRDDLGNRYQRVNAPTNDPYAEHVEAEVLIPKGEVVDVIVFEKPQSSASTLTLELPGRAVSCRENLSIEIPVAQIVSVDEFGLPKRVDEAMRPAVSSDKADDRM